MTPHRGAKPLQQSARKFVENGNGQGDTLKSDALNDREMVTNENESQRTLQTDTPQQRNITKMLANRTEHLQSIKKVSN